MYVYIYTYIYIHSLRKSNNYSLKKAQYKSVMLWEEDNAKKLYLILKVSCWQTNNLQPGTTIIKNLQYNSILNMTSFM